MVLKHATVCFYTGFLTAPAARPQPSLRFHWRRGHSDHPGAAQYLPIRTMAKGDQTKITGDGAGATRAPTEPLILPAGADKRAARQTSKAKPQPIAVRSTSPEQILAPQPARLRHSDVVVEDDEQPDPIAEFVARQADNKGRTPIDPNGKQRAMLKANEAKLTHSVMVALEKMPDATRADIARLAGLDRWTINEILTRLQAKGLVVTGASREQFRLSSAAQPVQDGWKFHSPAGFVVRGPSREDGEGSIRQVLLLVQKRLETSDSALLAVVHSASLDILGYFLCDESINVDILLASTERALRSALAKMDEEAKRKTIAALMALVGDLQAEGALNAVPPQRLARVALLIGQAHAAVVKQPSGAQRANLATTIEHGADDQEHEAPPLWREREVDPKTGKRPTAIEWFDLHWKPLVLAGEATGDDIRQRDFKFYESLASYQKSKGKKLSDLLPPSPTRSPKGETPEARAKRLSAAGTERKRRWRDAHREKNDEQEAPPLFEEREADATGKMPTALEWFDLHWKQRVADEGLRSDDVRQRDPVLYAALATAQSRAGASIGDLVPLSRRRLSEMSDEELADRRKRINDQSVERTRRHRQRERKPA